eukprot:2846-Pelagomonas_calceolata.AAC.5
MAEGQLRGQRDSPGRVNVGLRKSVPVNRVVVSKTPVHQLMDCHQSGKGDTLTHRAVSLPHQMVSWKLMCALWGFGSRWLQGIRDMVFLFGMARLVEFNALQLLDPMQQLHNEKDFAG